MSNSSFVGEAIHPSAKVAFLVIGSAMVISGVLGNILLFLTVVLKQFVRKRCAHHLFIGNKAVADFLTLGYWFTFFVLDLELGYHPVVNRTHCIMNGLIISTMFLVSISLMTCVTLNRFLSVCHCRLYQRLFTFRRTVVICVAIWVWCGIMAIPPAFPWVSGYYQYNKVSHVCSYDRNGHTYPRIITLLYAVVPMCLIAYWNWAIFRVWRASRASRMGMSPVNPQPDNRHAAAELTNERNLSSRKVKRNDRSGRVGLSHLAGEGDATDDSSPEGHDHDGTEGEDSKSSEGGYSSDNVSSSNEDATFHHSPEESAFAIGSQESANFISGSQTANEDVAVHDSPKDEPASGTRSEESADISGGTQTANEADDSNIPSCSSVDCQSSSTTTHGRKDKDATSQATTPRAESEEPTQQPATGEVSQCSDGDKISHVETTKPTSADRDRSAKAGARQSKRQRHMESLKRRDRKKLAREKALVRSLLVVSVLLFAFFLPFGVILSISLHVVLPTEVIVLAVTLLFFNSSANWIVYGVMNPQFRKSYVRCFRALASLLPFNLPCKTLRKKNSSSSRSDRS